MFAIADKMEDSEEVYANGIEEENEKFLEGLQNKKSLGELEEEYSKKVKEIRNIYEKSIKKELEQEAKNTKVKKIDLEIKKGEPYKAHCLKMEKSWGEKKKIDITCSRYKTERKIKNFYQRFFPKKIIYFFYRSKIVMDNCLSKIGLYLENLKNIIVGVIKIIFSGIKTGILGIASGVKKIADRIKKLFLGKNSKKDEDKNSTTEKDKAEGEKTDG